MTGCMDILQDFKPFNGGFVNFAGDKGGRITGEGSVSNGRVCFDKVNYVEELKFNLLSVSQICDKRVFFSFYQIRMPYF